MGVDPSKTPDDIECIRCGDCVKNCPTKALEAGFYVGKRKIGARKPATETEPNENSMKE
jgi:ferredoxin